MKILSYEIKDGMLRVMTDVKEFVYFKDQFKTLDELKAEINKHIAYHEPRVAAEQTALTNLKSQLDEEVK